MREYIALLRSNGVVSEQFQDLQSANEWRAALRRACRVDHLMVRTFISPEQASDATVRVVAYAQDQERLITVEEMQRAVEALPTPPWWQRPDRVVDGHRDSVRQAVEPRESVFMEITRREDIGADLNAPATARGGVATASYALVPLVRPGDVVVHYNSRREAIVGVSVVTASAESAPVFWVSRGSYARRAGERPGWLNGIRVPLSHYRELQSPLTLTEIRAEKDAILAMRARMQADANGQPIYFPWIPYRDTLRTFQSYLVKFPMEAIGLFPELRAAVEEAEVRSPGLAPASPVEQAEDAVNQAAGKAARRGRGQGFQLDQEVKVAVEARAMNTATEFYAESWHVEDVHGKECYDLICRRGDDVKHVEVKGTTTDGAEVILTPNEVRHARKNRQNALFVLSDVRVERADDGTVRATGGVHHLYDPWNIDEGNLTPIGFRYQVPDRDGAAKIDGGPAA